MIQIVIWTSIIFLLCSMALEGFLFRWSWKWIQDNVNVKWLWAARLVAVIIITMFFVQINIPTLEKLGTLNVVLAVLSHPH